MTLDGEKEDLVALEVDLVSLVEVDEEVDGVEGVPWAVDEGVHPVHGP